MCGIAGLLGPQPDLAAATRRMGAAIAHRGPDAAADWVDADAGVGLAHCRLAIQDLSAAGAQPMVSASGRYVLCYNGEIYSGAEMRAALPGHPWRGHSDTEALLESIEARGLEAALAAALGMFAFALWDRERRELTLVRDRLGIKPLYWQWEGGVLRFASELKAILAVAPAPEIDRAALADYLRLGYIRAPRSIHAGIQKLEPGSLVRIRAGAEPRPQRWWDLGSVLAGIGEGERIADPAEAEALIETVLAEAVRSRLISDVPIGCFLSGGIDSTLITALMQEASPEPVLSFSIGSPERAYDEAAHARAVAAHLGTRHTELELDEAACLAAVPGIGRVYDEPFGDSSAVPTLLLSQLTRAHVTVALSGDGGDELFAGYNRHRWYGRLAGSRVPVGLRRMAGSALGALPPRATDRAGRTLGLAGAARRMPKLAGMLTADGMEAAYDAAVTQWEGLVAEPAPRPALPDLTGLAPVEQMQVLDTLSYLPDDILTKVDRASMAHALEVRVPFLDHRVVRAAFRLAPGCKIEGRTTKRVLRGLLAKRLPRELFERPKQGFAIPVEHWLRGGLADWAGDLIAGTDWAGLGIAAAPVRQAWEAHRSARADHTDKLWSIVMLADWEARRKAPAPETGTGG